MPKKKTQPFDPYQGFDSPDEAVELAAKQPDPVEAVIEIVAANIRMGEYGFASEVAALGDTI